MSVWLPRDLEVLVASYGGVGTTFLIEFLSQYRRTNDRHDGDGLKHLPMPPVSGNPRIRCVYVYGDPVAAAASLFQRDMQHAQSCKLLALRPDLSPIPDGMTLEAYARSGADRLHFEAHFQNWHDRYLVHPTLFLRYETLWDHLDALADFLELPPGALEAFPAQRARSTRLDALPPGTRAGLEQMYGGFRDTLAGQPDAEVRGAELTGKRFHLLGTRNLRMALARAARTTWRTRLRNPLSNATRRHAPRFHARLAWIKRRLQGD